MGFLDKLLGRSNAAASNVADKSKELAGDAKEKAEDMISHGHEQGEDHTHDDQTHKPPGSGDNVGAS